MFSKISDSVALIRKSTILKQTPKRYQGDRKWPKNLWEKLLIPRESESLRPQLRGTGNLKVCSDAEVEGIRNPRGFGWLYWYPDE